MSDRTEAKVSNQIAGQEGRALSPAYDVIPTRAVLELPPINCRVHLTHNPSRLPVSFRRSPGVDATGCYSRIRIAVSAVMRVMVQENLVRYCMRHEGSEQLTLHYNREHSNIQNRWNTKALNNRPDRPKCGGKPSVSAGYPRASGSWKWHGRGLKEGGRQRFVCFFSRNSGKRERKL